MQKAGTGFIYGCLRNLPAYRLPIRREIHYFDHVGSAHPGGLRFLKGITERLGSDATRPAELVDFFAHLKPRWFRKKRIKAGRVIHTLDAENVLFLRKFSNFVHQGPSDQAYLDLFSPYDKYVWGDITPGYSKLNVDEIRRVRDLLPDAKIILSVREPVARLWSQLNMGARREFRQKHGRPPGKEDLAVFSDLLSPDKLTEMVKQEWYTSRSRATDVYNRWGKAYGRENILVINFEDLTRKTDLVVDKICEFLATPVQQNKNIPENKKENAMKIELDDVSRKIVEAALGDELETYDEVFRQHKDRV